MIGLELNDTGITAAGPDGTLLEIEPGGLVSPGFTVIEKGRLQIGLAAEQRCRTVPRQTNHYFWDHLTSDPLQDPAYTGWTHADLAHAQLTRIWEQLAPMHQDVLVTVPDTYTGQQLGLLAGVIHALSIPAGGFVSQALAALPQSAPTEILLHLEFYLHRTVLTVLDCRRAAAVLGHVSLDELGLDHLRTAWMQAIADEFVRNTRFDPLHAADTEQVLYDRLPALLMSLNQAEDIPVEMTTASATHRIRLKRLQVEHVLMPLMDAIHRQVVTLRQDYFGRQAPATIFVSHHAAVLPGFCERLEAATGTRAHPLAQGAAAKGALAFGAAFPYRPGHSSVPFCNRIPAKEHPQKPSAPSTAANPAKDRPAATHLLYRSRGYPVSETPLVIGSQVASGTSGILIQGRTEGVSRSHCTVARRDGRLILTDTSTYGTFVNNIKIAGETELAVGQSIRVGTPGEELQVITCLENDETTAT